MTANERFALIWHKIERANKHITDLNNALRAFGATNPYRVGIKRDPDTRKPIYYMAKVDAVPAEISMILGDAVQNLRASLDHLAQQLCLVGSGGAGYRKNTSFFIAPNASEYERLVSRKVEGMRQDAVDVLRALEPYKGGNGNDFWVLHSLNNIEKHRAIVTAAATYRSVDIGRIMMRALAPAAEKVMPGAKLPALSIGLIPADNLCPLKEGDELFVDAADAEFDKQMKFTFDVAIYEPEVIKPRPMMEIVQHLANLVSNTVTTFKPLLS